MHVIFYHEYLKGNINDKHKGNVVCVMYDFETIMYYSSVMITMLIANTSMLG